MIAEYSAISDCGYSDSLTLCDRGHVRITVAPEDLCGSAAKRTGTAAAPGAGARCGRRGAELDRGRAYRDQRRAIASGVAQLAEQGVTHVVNCRPRERVVIAGVGFPGERPAASGHLLRSRRHQRRRSCPAAAPG